MPSTTSHISCKQIVVLLHTFSDDPSFPDCTVPMLCAWLLACMLAARKAYRTDGSRLLGFRIMSKPSNSKTQNKKTLDPYLARCEDILRKAGSKITKPRMAVLQCMADAMTSLSPRQIHQRIEANQLAPDVDQVSVYRILETFLEIGLVHQVHPSGEYIPCTHVDCEEDLHILTCCKACDTTEEIDIPASLFAPTSWHLKHKHGFSIQGQLIQIDGLCATCADSHHHGAQA